MPKHNLSAIALPTAVLIVMCVLPFTLGVYKVEILIILLTNVILVASYRGMTSMGYWSLGHAVTMGVGAYAAALMARELGFSFWVTLPLGGLCAAAWMLLLSYPLSRMKGFAFFIGSFAAAEALRLAWTKFQNPFGGVRGLINIPAPSLGDISLSGTTQYYFLALVITAVCLFVMHRIDQSRIGDSLRAVASQGILADCIGINIIRYKTISFAISGFFAGMAGVLLVYRLGAVDPHLFFITISLTIIFWAVVGGTRTFAGPIIGLCVYTAINESLRQLVEWRPLALGIVLILVLLFLPGGIESLPAKISPLVRKLRSKLRGA